MSRFTIFVLCVQACLIQIAFSQRFGCPCKQQISYAPVPVAVTAPTVNVASSCGYGGSGTGEVGVTGDIDASGQTCVVGSVPVLGQVDFSGTVPAAGSVSISGQCGCGCQ